jgi:hypothetical protein
MSNNEEMTIPRGESEDPREAERAELAAQLEEALGQATPELAAPLGYWNIWARGPFQGPGLQPNRIIKLGEAAWIWIAVYLNPFFPSPAPGMNACDIITGFGAKIELKFFTSDTQRMEPVPSLNHTYCIQTLQTDPSTCLYWYRWEFTPERAACIYETNICARICNCDCNPVPQYAGFVRWVRDFDVDYLFPPVPWIFDHPVRYMVSDMSDCDCPDLC